MITLFATQTPTLFAALLAGVVSFLSPCVLPLVPGYLSLMSGLSARDIAASERRSRIALNAGLFVLGFTLVFVSYGAAASVIGAVLSDHKRLFARISGVVIVVMGLGVAGLYRLPLFAGERRIHVSPARLGPYAAPVMGMAFAFGWTPCIGPVLAAVLTLAAERETLSSGVALLFVYSVGLGVPFLLSALLFDRFSTTWTWLKRRGRIIDAFAGAVLIAFGLLLMTSQLGRVSSVVVSWWSALGLDTLKLG